MDSWVLRAMERWPNVPALFGWLGLDRRGGWLIRGESIRHPRIIETINRNYAADEYGRWHFQNGPQRGFIALASAPFILRVSDDRSSLTTHTGLTVMRPSAAFVDEHGSVLIATEHGAGELLGADLEWILPRLHVHGAPVDDDELTAALSAPSGVRTALTLEINGSALPFERLDFADAPSRLGFMRDPQPREDEPTSSGAPD